jgi:hypothetical protein
LLAPASKVRATTFRVVGRTSRSLPLSAAGIVQVAGAAVVGGLVVGGLVVVRTLVVAVRVGVGVGRVVGADVGLVEGAGVDGEIVGTEVLAVVGVADWLDVVAADGGVPVEQPAMARAPITAPVTTALRSDTGRWMRSPTRCLMLPPSPMRHPTSPDGARCVQTDTSAGDPGRGIQPSGIRPSRGDRRRPPSRFCT